MASNCKNGLISILRKYKCVQRTILNNIVADKRGCCDATGFWPLNESLRCNRHASQRDSSNTKATNLSTYDRLKWSVYVGGWSLRPHTATVNHMKLCIVFWRLPTTNCVQNNIHKLTNKVEIIQRKTETAGDRERTAFLIISICSVRFWMREEFEFLPVSFAQHLMWTRWYIG